MVQNKGDTEMDLFEMICVLKKQYADEIEKKKLELEHLQVKMEVLEDLSALSVEKAYDTIIETETAQTAIESDEYHGDEEQSVDGNF